MTTSGSQSATRRAGDLREFLVMSGGYGLFGAGLVGSLLLPRDVFVLSLIRVGAPSIVVLLWAPMLAYALIWRAAPVGEYRRQSGMWIEPFRIVYALIIVIISFGVLYSQTGLICTVAAAPPIGLGDYFYFSVITWTTVGYGDFVPAGGLSRALAAYEALLGYVTMAALLATLVLMSAESRQGGSGRG